MKMTNGRNLMVYRLWAPIYDSTVNRGFMAGRRRASVLLNPQAGERVLLPGVGTGADLPLLPPGVNATGIDISPAMLARAALKLQRSPARIELLQGDAQLSLVEDSTFDAAILNLILSVIPDGKACLVSTLRALKPGGRLVIFDKFLSDGNQASPARRLINIFSTLFGTDINRRLGDLMHGCPCRIVHEEPSLGGGLYRVVLLRKTEEVPSPSAAVPARMTSVT